MAQRPLVTGLFAMGVGLNNRHTCFWDKHKAVKTVLHQQLTAIGAGDRPLVDLPVGSYGVADRIAGKVEVGHLV